LQVAHAFWQEVRYGTGIVYSIYPMTAGTLLYQEFEALDLVDQSEARFRSSAVRDAVRLGSEKAATRPASTATGFGRSGRGL
jgi:hypothetical protein